MTRTAKLAITLSIFAVSVWLFLIGQPYIDRWSWRQSDVASIARNLREYGFYFFLRWIDSEKSISLFAAATVISLALLIKLPSAIIGAPLLFFVWQKWRWNFVRQPSLWLFATITILPSIAWYWHAHQISEK